MIMADLVSLFEFNTGSANTSHYQVICTKCPTLIPDRKQFIMIHMYVVLLGSGFQWL